jgi:branched-chain amino acid transport system ATP-binding protein
VSLLELRGISAGYDGVPALTDVSLEVREGEIVTLIGANGAGKSTTLKTIAGLVAPSAGEIHFRGARLDGEDTERIVTRGICLVPEGRRIFPGLTVLENLEVGFTPRRRRPDAWASSLARVFEMFPRLDERRAQLGWSLSGGEQQMLAISRALMADPALLLLDEPSLGLAPALVQALFATIRDINRAGTTILLVEQNAFMALKTAQRGYVLENGRVVLSDDADRLLRSPHVREAYLGSGGASNAR